MIRSLPNIIAGIWQLDRKSSDGSRFIGAARFTLLNDSELRLRESGELKTAAGARIPGERSWIWRFESDLWLRIFYDEVKPRLYHDLVFSGSDPGYAARDEHQCDDDSYLGNYVIQPDRIAIETKVSGPKKNYVLNSIYLKTDAIPE